MTWRPLPPPRQPPPLPPRPRAISQPDAEVPESVYHALKGVQDSVTALTQAVAVGKADTDQKIAEVKSLAEKASALAVERWTNLAKALVPAVVAIVGGTYGVQRLAAPEPQHMTVVSRDALSVDLEACGTLPESNQPACVGAAYQRDQARKHAPR